MRTLIYARYSTDHQNSRSVDDQVAVCRERAAREGWEIVGIYTDAAISGAAGLGQLQRPGMNALLEHIKAGGIQQLLAESTSRISRDEGDGYELRRHLKHWDVRLFTLSDGVVDDFVGTFRGLLDAQQRRDIAAHVKRGQRGTVADGRVPGGLAYGYKVANIIGPDGELLRGLREIDEDKAEIVRGIFTAYAGGSSTRDIALRLNAEGIPSPAGCKWTPSTILGDRKRRDGMLKNRLYIGLIVHFRTRKVDHPTTRRQLIRPLDEAEEVIGEAPHLRIVSDELWQRVQAEIARRAIGPIHSQRRPKRLLSGLMKCGQCGGPMIVGRVDQWVCAGQRTGKGCTNRGSIMNGRAEALVLHGLQQELVEPEIVEAHLAEYAARRAQRARDLEKEKTRINAALGEIGRKIEKLVDVMERGADEFEEIRDLMRARRAERDRLTAELRSIERIAPLTLHPAIAQDYRRQIEALTSAVAQPEARQDVIPKIRALIGTIIATPAQIGRGLDLTVEGQLENILRLATGEGLNLAQSGEIQRRTANAC